jgi:hypothetical protein
MAAQSQQVIAVVPPTTDPSDVQEVLEKHLFQKFEFQGKRLQTAFLYATTATLGVVVALLVATMLDVMPVSRLPETYKLFAPFVEWSNAGTQDAVCSWECEILTQSTRLFNAVSDVGVSIVSREDGQGNIAGIARLCTLVSVSIVVWFAYRKQLVKYYTMNAQQAQLNDFNSTPRWQFWLSRVLYTLAALFGTYVVVSIIWFGLSLVFKNLSLGWFNAAVVIVVFTWAAAFAAAVMALAASTRHVLLLGLFIFVFGFSASFALAPTTEVEGLAFEWWQGAVSNAGRLNPSAALFTGTLFSGSLALVMMWFDINSIIQTMINDGNIRWLTTKGWMWVARLLYVILIVGLLAVGFVRVDRINFPINTVFHAGGAVFAVASVVVSALLIRKRRFHPWYKIFSVHILLGVTVGMAVFGSLRFDPFTWVSPGSGIISLTVIELTLLILIGLWAYITVDNLLGQANIKAFEGEVIMVRQDQPR